MKKREVIGVTRGWWAWVGGKPAVEFETEQQVSEYMVKHAQAPSDGFWQDSACPVRYILWNCPLETGKSYHKVIFDPVTMIAYNGHARKILFRIIPSKLKRMDKDWVAEYRAAEQDDSVMVTIGKKNPSLLAQLASRWP